MKNKVNRASLGAKKNLNLFTWLLECSGNAAKIGLIPCQPRQQDGKNTAKGRQKDGKSSIYRRIITLLTLLLTLGVGQMWAADPTIFNCGIDVNDTWYKGTGTINSGNWLSSKTAFNSANLGVLTSLELGGQYDTWDNNQTDYCSWNTNNGIWITIYKNGTQKTNFKLSCFHYGISDNNNTWKTSGTTGGCSDSGSWGTYTLNISAYTPGNDYTIKASWTSPSGKYTNATASFTIPGFISLSTTSVTFDNTTVGGYSSESITYTHYGTAPTNDAARYSITGTNADQFSITALSGTGATIQFHPTSAGNKTATLVINDVHGKTTGSITLTGKTQYTVSYNKGSNGTGANTTANKVFGTDLILLGATFTRSGYYQTAWNTNAAGTGGTSYGLGADYTTEAALTLYPTWSQWTMYCSGAQVGSAFVGTGNTNEYYMDINTSTSGFNAGALRFMLGSNNYHPDNCNLADGDWHNMSYHGDDGNFAWTAPPASNTNWRIFIKLDGSTWKVKAVRRYTVTYAGNGSDGGSAPTNSNTYATGETFSVASNSFTRTGYDFNIWNDGTSNYEPNDTYTIGTQDVTLTAQWTAKSFTITFDKNSGTSGSDSQTTTYDATTSDITSPTRAGFTFEGYYTTESDNNGTGTQVIAANGSWNSDVASYTSAGKWIVTSAQTLYAKWSEIVTPTVTVTPSSEYYAASRVGEVNLSITFTHVGATDWKYRVYTGDKVAFYTPDNQTLGSTGTVVKNWVANCGIPAGDLTFRVELLDATNALQATSAPFILHMETPYEVSLSTKTDNAISTAGGSISTSGPLYPAPHVSKTITANAANSGYSFVNWTASNANITIADPTALSTTITASATGTVYANYSSVRDINVYIYKYDEEMTGTVISATPYIGSAAQTNVTGAVMSTTADGLWYKYTFANISSISGLVIQWASGGTTGSTLSGNAYSQDIYIYQSGKTAPPTLVTTHDVTVSAGANGSVTPTGTIKVPATTFSIPITATTNTSFAFEQWATTGGVTITSGSTRSGTVSIQATADGTVSASFAQLVYFVNSDNWEDVMIYVWDGSTESFGEWPGKAMTDAGFDVTIGGVTYDVYSVTGMSENLDGFIFNNGVTGAGKKQTGNLTYSTSLIGQYFYAERCYTADASTNNPGTSGTYWYATYDALRAASPSCFDITVKLDGKTESSKTISGGTSTSNIVATVPAWYNFDEWVVERGNATFGSATNPNTNITSASPDAVIKATFTTDKMIYFQNVPGWTNVYVRLLGGNNRWSNDHGINLGYNDPCYQMHRIPNTNIYYYNYKNESWTGPYVAFSEHNNNNCNADYITWLGASSGAYRGDFNTCAPMYVPENYITEYKTFSGCSQAAYYNSRAYWTTYNGTSSGFKLWIKSADNSTTIAEVDMTGTEESRFYTHTVALEAGTGYHVYFQSCAGTYYGVSGNMTPANCSNWNIYSGSQNTYVQTTAAGDYTFTLHCLEDGHLQFSVEYPLNVGDYRVVYEELESSTVRKYHPSDIIRQIYALNDSTKDDTVSFFVNKDANAYTKKLVVERCSSIVGTTITWTPTGQELSVGDLTAGVYNFKLTQSYTKTGDVKSVSSITKIGTYTGDYYVRSDGAYDGWDGHSKGTANTMTYSEASLETQAEFDYYLCKFTLSGTNVKFTVANDYSPCISDTLEGDPLSTDPLYNRQTLPADANIRFMWNSQTNAISRAYVHGSSAHQRYLVLTGDAKVFDEDGDPIAADGAKGLAANELEFQDMGNWVYQVDLQAKSGATAKVSANYNSRVSYFVGSSTTSKTVISSEDASTQYALRSVYDFKTNLFWSAWKAGHVASDLTLNTNVLMIRHAQDAANAVTLGTGADVLKVDSAYAAIELRKSEMVGQLNTDANIYTYCMYYISFPFDVKVSDIFGAGSKGIEWELYKYRGDLRAQRGWFAETDSFWEVMSDNDIMEAGTGYVLGLDETIFNSSSASVWTNVADATYIYFPSKDKVGTISSNTQSYTLPSHQCDINRTFVVGGIGTLSHTFTDSHWNMMGIPLFESSTGNPGSFLAVMDGEHRNIGYFYEWSATTNTYTITSTESYTFKTLFGYMTQYTGTVTFTGASIKDIVSAPVRDETERDYKVELSLAHEDEFASRTYVELKDGACDTFALCEDVYMIQSSSIADIYTFAGAYDVGANVRSVNSCIIPIGVNVHKAGTYTFSMPSAFTGTVTLIDNFLGTRTDLGLGDYTTSLNKGMDNERFSLELNIERSSATDIEGIEGGTIKDGKAHKFIRDGIMYIFRDGVIYDAMGKRVK